MIIEGPLTVWTDRVEIVKTVVLDGEEDNIVCKNCLLTHSFINAHTHLPMILLRGLVTEKNFWDWLEEIRMLEELMNKKDIWAGYVIGIWENVLSGNTTVYSMYRGYNLVKETFGVELHIGPLSTREADTDVFTLLERFEQKKPEGVVTTLYAHSLYLMPISRLKEIAEIPLEFQIHVAETKEEVRRVKEKFGSYPARVLHTLGLLRSNTMLVHAGWITKSELDLVSQTGSILVHVPASNYRLAIHGFFPWKEARERGTEVMFGTDSAASNDGQSILHDLRLALLTAKDRYWDASLFNFEDVRRAFDRKGFALWEPIYPIPEKGFALINTFLYSPHLFRLRLLWKNGNILFPRPLPREVRKALRIAERFRDRV